MAFAWLTRLFQQDRMAVGSGDSYINSALAALDTYYATGGANVYQTAAVEFALGMVARAFMLAEPSLRCLP